MIFEGRALADLGLTDWFGVQLEWPLRVFHTAIRYEDDAGVEVPILGADIHHRDETLIGSGDPLIGTRLGTRTDDWLIEARAGLRLPVGRTEENPYTEEAIQRPHQHFQLGSGTVDPELGVAAEYMFEDWSLGAWVWSRLTVYENDKGHQAGHRFAGGLVAASPLGLDRWRFSALLETQTEFAERWDGKVPTDDGNQGRTDVYAGLGAQFRTGLTWFALGVRTPVYSQIAGGQLEIPFVAELSLGGSLDVWKETEPEPPEEPVGEGDVADIATGQAPEPVAERVTIVDYKAVWCVPCKDLEQRLNQLAKRFPAVSVRRFDVGDEAPEGIVLPHVKLYDARGVLVWEGSGDPIGLEAELEARLQKLLPAP